MNGRKRLACNKNDIYFENFVCCCNMADKFRGSLTTFLSSAKNVKKFCVSHKTLVIELKNCQNLKK